jgi:molecular chaperone GrpE
MMTKKRSKDQEEKQGQINNKATDNKEHNNENGNAAPGSSENLIPENESVSGEVAAESEPVVSDKVLPEVRAIEEKLAEMQDKYIRLSAEFDNYRKRTLREKIELSKYASEELLRKIIPIMDDFDRAKSHMESATDCEAMKEGMDLIYNKFAEFLKQSGIKEIEALNVPFDVDLHDAVAKIQVKEEEKKGKVVDVVLKGYYLQDKILRHSKVVVGE